MSDNEEQVEDYEYATVGNLIESLECFNNPNIPVLVSLHSGDSVVVLNIRKIVEVPDDELPTALLVVGDPYAWNTETQEELGAGFILLEGSDIDNTSSDS